MSKSNSLDFEFRCDNQKRAVLLFHGMTGSPFEMKKFGKSIHKAGYNVFCYCLPGHGHQVNDIKKVKWQDWYNSSVYYYKKLKEEYDEVYLAGLCMGAVLALAIAEEYKDVAGIISLSSTLYLDGWTIPWYNFLLPLGLYTIVKYFYAFPEREPYGIKNEIVRRKISKLLTENTVAFDNYPMSCVYELLELSKYTRKHIKKVSSPILLFHAREDDLTSIKSSDFVYNKVSSKIKEYIILENSYHIVVIDNEKEFVFNKSIEFLNSISEMHNNSTIYDKRAIEEKAVVK